MAVLSVSSCFTWLVLINLTQIVYDVCGLNKAVECVLVLHPTLQGESIMLTANLWGTSIPASSSETMNASCIAN